MAGQYKGKIIAVDTPEDAGVSSYVQAEEPAVFFVNYPTHKLIERTRKIADGDFIFRIGSNYYGKFYRASNAKSHKILGGGLT